MQKLGLTFGVIGGVLLSAFLLLGMVLWQEGVVNFDTGEIWGYTTMLVAMSAVFFGIKSYRDKHVKGPMRFWKGLQMGLLISFVAAVMYAASWEVYRVSQPENYARFIAEYTQCQIDRARDDGASQEEIDEMAADMASFKEWYKNPLLRFGVTIAEVLPVGILVSLVSAGLLRRREVATR